MSKCSNIMSKNVSYCFPAATVEDVAELMKTLNIGCIPVLDNAHNKQVIGVITDRDLVVRVLGGRRNPSTTTAGAVMTKNPVTCTTEDTIEDAITRMEQHQIRRLPVVDRANQIVGIISEADIATRLDETYKAGEFIQAVSRAIK